MELEPGGRAWLPVLRPEPGLLSFRPARGMLYPDWCFKIVSTMGRTSGRATARPAPRVQPAQSLGPPEVCYATIRVKQ